MRSFTLRKQGVAVRSLARRAALVAVLLPCSIAATDTPTSAGSCSKQVVAYYPSYQRELLPPSEIDWAQITTLNHAFLYVAADGSLWEDDSFRSVRDELVAAAHANRVSILAVIGGGGDAGRCTAKNLQSIAADPVLRVNFAIALREYCERHGYNGVTIDWESPGVIYGDWPQCADGGLDGNATSGQCAEDRINFGDLSYAIFLEFNAASRPLRMEVALPGTDDFGMCYEAIPLSTFYRYSELMTYNNHGTWSEHVGHNSQLFMPPADDPYHDSDISISAAVDYWEGRGVPKSLLLGGLPFYGWSYPDAEDLYSEETSGSAVDYRSIGALTAGPAWTRHYDDEYAHSPWLTRNGGPGLVCYDDAQSIGEKTDWIAGDGLAGVMIWEVSQDLDDLGSQPLLDAIGSRLCVAPYETNCADGVDGDSDGAADCADADCGACCTPEPGDDCDLDGVPYAEDCDDHDFNCTTDCSDADSDGLCPPADCDDSESGCTADCTDADGDQAAACAGDCDDSNPNVYPGAPEICDGLDNQCPGDSGYGDVDEGCVGSCDRSFSSQFIVTPGLCDTSTWSCDGSPTGTSISSHFEGYFWALGSGDPTPGQGNDNGEWPALEGFCPSCTGWVHADPNDIYLAYIGQQAWDGDSRIDGCIDQGGSDTQAFDLDECMALLLVDGYYFAYLVTRTDASGDFLFPADAEDWWFELGPTPTLTWLQADPYDPCSWETCPAGDFLMGPISEESLFIDDACPSTGPVGYRVYQCMYEDVATCWPSPKPTPGSGWEVAIGGERVDGQPLPLDEMAHVIYGCESFFETYIAATLVFDGGFETGFVRPYRTTWCCVDADKDAACVWAESGVLDCNDNDPNNWESCASCADGDSDGYYAGCDAYLTISGPDCDDSNPDVYAGAPEICDGLDNQCPGDPGYGLIDEIADSAGFENPADRNEFSWPELAGATSYEVARSGVADLSEACTVVVTTAAYWSDGAIPATDTVFYYLVRALAPYAGSWGEDSFGTERTNVCP